MAGNKAMKRALKTSEAYRIGGENPVPNLYDKTVDMTPEEARKFLDRNRCNRPISMIAAQALADQIKDGKWKVHGQGIILDTDGYLLTGQTRLWAVILAKIGVWMRVSYNNPKDAADVIDRGRPQSARDLASRRTNMKHAAAEGMIARAICAMDGDLRPSKDKLAATIVDYTVKLKPVLYHIRGTKKSKAVLMITAAICRESHDEEEAVKVSINTQVFADELELMLHPQSARTCWNKGAAFSMALERAREIVNGRLRDAEHKYTQQAVQ
jgi:hypothetical protein